MNSFKRAKTTESGDMVYTEYKGKTFAIPRSDYKKPLQTFPGQPSLTTTASNLTSVSQRPEKQLTTNEQPFSLDALFESRSTLNQQPTPTASTQTVSTTKGFQPPPAVIADSLLHLKSNVVELIDKTISDIETKQQQLKQEKSDPSAAVYLHPGGDSPKTGSKGETLATAEVPHRAQNLQVLKTESFAQSKRDVRKRLYQEIETILMRLKDMDFLE